jgi:hypothetical protein
VNKRAVGRPQDRRDVRALERALGGQQPRLGTSAAAKRPARKP